MPNIRIVKVALVAGLCVLGASVLRASGPLGIFAIIEKVVFEPNEANAERVQVWGAFAFVEGGVKVVNQTSAAKKGYLYFRMSPVATAAQMEMVRNEWRDLKTVAGTGQAVGFGSFFYLGGFGTIDPAAPGNQLPTSYRGVATDMRVHAASEAPKDPAVYETNVGVVKLGTEGTQGAAVKKLKDALAVK